MRDPLFDATTIIDALNGHSPALDILVTSEPVTISRITWIEVLAGAAKDRAGQTETFLNGCALIELDEAIALRAARVRRETRLKLPDAITYATALVTGRTLVTRNTKDFSADMPNVDIPYILQSSSS